jgi:hypothetical protein
MKGYLQFLKYAKPYKALAALNILCNILSILFGMFSITLNIPFLG